MSLLLFILGTLIGSFLNVVIYRLGTGQGLGGRSRCMTCSRNLRWFELVPVCSFLVQQGRCRRCLSKISSQYLWVELLTGLTFALVGLRPYYLVIFCLLIVILIYDWRHQIIPDEPVYAFIALAFLLRLAAVSFWPGFLTGLGLALFFAGLWYFSGGRWLGLGDAKLALGMGWFLGFAGGVSAVALAFWIGAAVGLLLIGLRGASMKTALPFAPFLILGLALNFIFHWNVFNLL
jgi:leader peptidase (prepilin peptidase)/N-methyltransferase